MLRKHKLAGVVIVCVMTIATQSRAATQFLIDTSPDVIGIDEEFGASNISTSQNFVTQFSLNSSFRLTAIDSYHENFGVNFLGFDTRVRIYEDDNGSVGGLLHDIVSNVTIVDFDGDSLGVFERRFTPFSQTLTAGTYWVGVSGMSAEFGQMLVNDMPPREHRTAQMAGTSLSILFPDHDDQFDQAAIRLSGVIVPEPTSYALALTSLCLVVRRRRA